MPAKPPKLTAQDRKEAQRLKYYKLRDENVPRTEAETSTGLYRGVGAYLGKLVDETGKVRDRPRCGGPKRYTDELLDQATEVLVAQEDEAHDAQSFVLELERLNILTKPYKTRAFMSAWKKRVKEQGHFLNTRSTGCLFLICKEDAPKRVEFARRMKQLLPTPGSINDCAFEDESEILQSPHPKSGVY